MPFIQLNVRELRHLGSRVQPQIIQSLEARARADNRYNNEQRAEAATAVAVICLESLSGKKPEEAMEWLLLSASLGNEQAKSYLYRVSKALGLYEKNKEEIMKHLADSAKTGIPISVDDLTEADLEKGQEVLQFLKFNRRHECQFHATL